MSLKKRFETLSAGLGQEASAVQPAEQGRKPRTAPGQLMAFREHVLQADEQVADLRKRLEQFEGATPAQRLDPRRVRPSEYANRHPDQFKTAAYETLKRDIAATEGNVEAILVRPIPGNEVHDYEVVFGHRRHRACLDLGIPVLALIREVTDTQLWVAMFAENLDRENLSPYETGVMYRNALSRRLFASQDELAAKIGRSKGHISQAMQVAGLPADVLGAFDSPIHIQYRWAIELQKLLAKDRQEVIERVESLRGARDAGRSMKPSEVYEALVRAPKAKRTEIRVAGKVAAAITQRPGGLSVVFSRGSVPPARVAELKRVLAGFLAAGEGAGADEDSP